MVCHRTDTVLLLALLSRTVKVNVLLPELPSVAVTSLTVTDGLDEPQSRYPHVLHRTNGRGDVDRILRLVEHDDDSVEEHGRGS